MTIRSRGSRRTCAVAVVTALLVGACGGPAASSPPAATPSTIPSPASLPAGWAFRSTTDPALRIGLPSGWETSDPTAAGIAASATPVVPSPDVEASATPVVPSPDVEASAVSSGTQDAEEQYLAWTQELIESRAVRMIGSGPMTWEGRSIDGASIRVTVESGDSSLGGFANRKADELRAVLGLVPERSVVGTPLGVSVRLAHRALLSGSVAFVARDYLSMLPDGRSLDVAIEMPDAASDAAADDFAATVIGTARLAR